GSEDVRGADGRMTGKGQLTARREDSHSGGVGRILGRENERRLGIVELPRDRLHERGIDPPRIGEDGKLVSTEGPIGENVDGKKASSHGHHRATSSISTRAPNGSATTATVVRAG